jgi:CRP-like cAMP-binding protein
MEVGVIRNGLLRRMDAASRTALAGIGERVHLGVRTVVCENGAALEHVYFPDGGLLCVIAVSGNDQIEIAHIGGEGMIGASALCGVARSSSRVVVQAACDALRVPVHLFSEFLEDHAAAREVVALYREALAIQIEQAALTNGIFNLEQRLACWLLMCQDRLGCDQLEVTHEFISNMLGVRRAGVTSALHVLEGNHLIRSVRGSVAIRDRDGLRLVAGGSYGVAEAAYEQLLGSAATTAPLAAETSQLMAEPERQVALRTA